MIEPCDAADTPLRAEAGDRRQRSTSGVVTLSQGVFCAVVAVVAGSRGGSSPQRLCFTHRHGRRSAVHPFKEHAGPVWLDDVSCSGKESGLLQCSRRPWGAHDCSHREDVALACYLGGEGHRPTLGEDHPALRVPEWVAPAACVCPPTAGSLSHPAVPGTVPTARPTKLRTTTSKASKYIAKADVAFVRFSQPSRLYSWL